ncbi:MAG TPA: AsmA-like C-terminal region-containing protein, partial [Planctomycetota bacterium]|nr:AsmA-like C-terminal region-containing protein [Planctomycetota bacterium]
LSDVRFGDPANPDLHVPVARVELAVAIGEGPRVKRIVLEKPVLRAERIDAILPREETPEASSLPSVVVHDGTVVERVSPLGELRFREVEARADPFGDEIRIAATARTPLRGLLRLRGTANPVTGALELAGSTDEPVDLATLSDAELDPEIEKLRHELDLVGRASVVRAVLSRARSDAPLRLTLDLEATAAAATVPGLGVRPVDVGVRVSLSEQGVGRVSAKGRVLGAGFEALGDFSFDIAKGALGPIRGGVAVRELILGQEVERVLRTLDDGAASVYRGLEPAGPVDVTLAVAWSPGAGAPEVVADIDFRRGSVTLRGIEESDGTVDAAFPYPVTDLVGRISYRPGRIVLADVRGLMGSGRFSCGGEITGTGRVGLDLAFRVEALPLDSTLGDAVASLPDGRASWALFDLEGKVGIDVAVTRTLGERRARVVIRAGADGGITGVYRGFPIPVEGLSGAVVFDGGTARFAFDGRTRGGTARIEGEVDDARDASGREAERSAIRLRIGAKRVDLDRTFAPSLAGAARGLSSVLEELEPQAKIDLDYRGERERDAPIADLGSVVTVVTRGATLRRLPRLDVRIEDVAASLRVGARGRADGELDLDVHLDSVKGRYRGRPVCFTGVYRARGASDEDSSLDLTGIGIDLPLDGELVGSMAGSGSADARRAVAKYAFGGRFDLTMEARRGPLVGSRTTAELDLRDTAITGPGLPGTMDGGAGLLTVDAHGRLAARSLSVRVDGTPLLLESFSLRPSTPDHPLTLEGSLTSLEPIPLVSSLSKTTAEARAWLEGIGFDAKVEPKGLSWRLEVPDVGVPRLDASGTIVMSAGTCPAVGLRDLAGNADVESLRFDESGFRTLLRGYGGTFHVGPGLAVTEFSGTVEITPELLEIRDGSGSFADGKLISTGSPLLRIRLDQTPRAFEMSTSVRGGQLARLFEKMPGASDVRGRFDFQTSVQGRSMELQGYKGGGRFEIRDASLFGVPFFQAIYEELQFKERPVFKEADGRFTLRDGALHFDKLDFESDPLGLVGAGTISLAGIVDLTFDLRPHAIITEIPLLGDLINVIQDRLVGVRVVGPIENPERRVLLPWTRRGKLRKQVVAPAPPVELGERF